MEIDLEKEILKVQWKDEHSSVFKLAWLNTIHNNVPSSASPYDVLMNYKLWDNSTFRTKGIPHVSYNDVMNSENDDGVESWTRLINKYGFGVVSGCPILPPNDTTKSREVMVKLGELSRTFFERSGVWDINVEQNPEKLDHADTAYTNFNLPPHVDGTYFSEPPGLQFFQIASHDGDGGETILVDGFQVGKYMEDNYPELFEYLSTVSNIMTVHTYSLWF